MIARGVLAIVAAAVFAAGCGSGDAPVPASCGDGGALVRDPVGDVGGNWPPPPDVAQRDLRSIDVTAVRVVRTSDRLCGEFHLASPPGAIEGFFRLALRPQGSADDAGASFGITVRPKESGGAHVEFSGADDAPLPPPAVVTRERVVTFELRRSDVPVEKRHWFDSFDWQADSLSWNDEDRGNRYRDCVPGGAWRFTYPAGRRVRLRSTSCALRPIR